MRIIFSKIAEVFRPLAVQKLFVKKVEIFDTIHLTIFQKSL